MARIRIVDEWLRSPASYPTQKRAVMVVAEGWAEQRVLMRAFANAYDQLRPTIMLHGRELSIGPAGTDAYGPWGIHVDSPADGWAQSLRGELVAAAKRFAGSKGNPPRLVDEVPRFESRATGYWAPGVPRDRRTPEPRAAADGGTTIRTTRDTSPLFVGTKGWENPLKTAVTPTPGLPVHRTGAQSLAKTVGKTLPVGFQLSGVERSVLNALGEGPTLGPERLAGIVGDSDVVAWMESFQSRLLAHGLDIFGSQTSTDGAVIYSLKR